MHERSLVQSLLTQVEQLCQQHDALSVETITVEIGPLSGVESELVRLAFDELVSEYFDNSPQLHIDTIRLRLRCRSCGRESSVDGVSLKCPECASVRVHIVRGDQIRLIDVAMQVPVMAGGE